MGSAICGFNRSHVRLSSSHAAGVLGIAAHPARSCTPDAPRLTLLLQTGRRAIVPVVEEFESLAEKLARVTAECERLRTENERLRRTLADPELHSEEKQRVRIPTEGVA